MLSRCAVPFAVLVVSGLAAAQGWVQVSAYVPLGALAWDPLRDRLLIAGSDPQPRLYEWDGSRARERQKGLLGQRTVAHLLADRTDRRLLAIAEDRWVGSWTGGNWAWRNGGSAPPTGPSAAAYDERRRRLVLVTNTTVHEWDGGQWWPAGSPPSPIAPTFAFAYDPRAQRCVLYGGAAGSAATWLWDGGAWTQLPAANQPGPRQGAGLAFDFAQRQQLVLYGGSAVATDTWAFDGAAWQLLSTHAGAGPQPDCRLVGTSQGPLLVATGGADAGRLWRLVGPQWQAAGTLPQLRHGGSGALAYDPLRGTAVAFGAGVGVFDRGWLPLEPAQRPPSRQQGHAAWSPLGQHVVAFGGQQLPAVFGDTWRWDGANWLPHQTGPSPAPRFQAVMAETVTGDVLLYGGTDLQVHFGDTWLWRGTGWQALQPAVAPPPRAHALAAYDPLRGEVVMWGGFSDTAQYLAETWVWNGTAWRRTPAARSVLATNAQVCVFHPPSGAVLGLGGAQSWRWDGSEWQATTSPTSSRTGRSMVFQTRRNQLLWLGSIAEVFTAVAADATAYGAGCALGPAPTVAVLGAPRPDSELQLEFATRQPQAPAFLVTGLATQSQPLGAGCQSLVGQVLGVHAAVADGGGIIRQTLAIPDLLALRGVQFAAQGAVFAPAHSPLGSVATSAGVLVTIGD